MSAPLRAGLRYGEPLSAAEIASRVITERALDAADKGLRRLMVKRVGMALQYQRTNGMVREVGGSGPTIVWEIAQ